MLIDRYPLPAIQPSIQCTQSVFNHTSDNVHDSIYCMSTATLHYRDRLIADAWMILTDIMTLGNVRLKTIVLYIKQPLYEMIFV